MMSLREFFVEKYIGNQSGAYVFRKVVPKSAKMLTDWCTRNGIKNAVPEDMFHLTVTATKQIIDIDLDTEEITVQPPYKLELLNRSIVIRIQNRELQNRSAAIRAAYPDNMKYETDLCHITLAYDSDQGIHFDVPTFPITLSGEKGKINQENWRPEKNKL